MNYWLVKSEPDVYSFDRLLNEKTCIWDGVRNYQARNNLMLMKMGDLVLFYHSNIGKEIVGIARVVKEHYPDPSSTDVRWVAVNLAPELRFKTPLTLITIKNTKALENLLLVRHSRLSVMPVNKSEFELIVQMGN